MRAATVRPLATASPQRFCLGSGAEVNPRRKAPNGRRAAIALANAKLDRHHRLVVAALPPPASPPKSRSAIDAAKAVRRSGGAGHACHVREGQFTDMILAWCSVVARPGSGRSAPLSR
jgi:hypothetical protein